MATTTPTINEPSAPYEIRTVQLHVAQPVSSSVVNTPVKAGHLLLRIYEDLHLDTAQEHLVALALDTGSRPCGFKILASGTETGAPLSLRMLFRAMLLLGAYTVVLAHNHPSGRLEPSRDDMRLTRRAVEAGDMIGIQVADHFILDLAGGKYLSLRESNRELFVGVQ